MIPLQAAGISTVTKLHSFEMHKQGVGEQDKASNNYIITARARLEAQLIISRRHHYGEWLDVNKRVSSHGATDKIQALTSVNAQKEVSGDRGHEVLVSVYQHSRFGAPPYRPQPVTTLNIKLAEMLKRHVMLTSRPATIF